MFARIVDSEIVAVSTGPSDGHDIELPEDSPAIVAFLAKMSQPEPDRLGMLVDKLEQKGTLTAKESTDIKQASRG